MGADQDGGATVTGAGHAADPPTGPGELRVLVVDDHKTVAELLSFALETEPGLNCVGTASDVVEAIRAAVELRPDVVVLDIEMPGQDGLAVTRRIREVLPESMIAVVSAHRDPEWVVRAAAAGASAFVSKDGSLAEMLDVLRQVRTVSALAPPTYGQERPPVASAATVPAPALTQREADVLSGLGRGLPPKLIARLLGISLHTCRGYVKSLHTKLGVRSQLEAVVRAQQLGLIRHPTHPTARDPGPV